MESSKPIPTPVRYVDVGTRETNGKLTPGNIGTVDGKYLKFEPGQPGEGIFFVSAGEDATEKKVGLVQKNKPSQLVFLTPAKLPEGEYWLEVRARPQGESELCVGRLDTALTVQGKG